MEIIKMPTQLYFHRITTAIELKILIPLYKLATNERIERIWSNLINKISSALAVGEVV